MPPIDGQFHNKLHLMRDDQDAVIGVAVSGPITHWDDDVPRARFEAMISSKDGQVLARGAVDGVQRSTVWMVAAAAQGASLSPGPAIGDVTAIAHTGTGDKANPWQQEIELV
jgi:hypothetical protein